MSIDNLDPEQIAEAIKWPVEKWPGNCYGVAGAIHKAGLVKGRLCYGIFHGYIDPNSCFGNRAFTHHGWVERRTTIYDPTRWVFDGVAPYIYVGPKDDDNYDFGGNALRKARLQPCPEFDPTRTPWSVPEELRPFVASTIGELFRTDGMLGLQQVMWFANMPLDMLGDYAKPVFEWIARPKEEGGVGLPGFIPQDNRVFILGK
jgi:hypothetical protein